MCAGKQECTEAHRYMCVHVYVVCVCVSVVTVLRECVPGPARRASCTKDLPVLPGGI